MNIFSSNNDWVSSSFSSNNDWRMARWEVVPPSEIRAEVEAVLESQGEVERIRCYLNAHPQIAEWRQRVHDLCRAIIYDRGIASLTADMIFEEIAPRAREMIPPEVRADIRAKLESFLQTQFEDHINK
jgi:hypothetical protein